MTELEADGGEELRMLMQQKLTRPTFKRVMSREPTRTPEEIELSRSTVLRILESLQEDEEFSSLRSEESPSDSADVELEDEDDDTVLGSLESSDSEYHSATEEQGALQGEAAADVGDDVLGGDVSFQMPGADTTGTRRRHTSKKKGKWLRYEQRGELRLPFANVRDEDLQPNVATQLAAGLLNADSSLVEHKLVKHVPCLKELCAKLVQKAQIEVPHVNVRDHLLGSHLRQSRELSSLLNKLRHTLNFYNEYETKLVRDTYNAARILSWFEKKDAKGHFVEYSRYVIPVRNIWEADTLFDLHSRNQEKERLGTRTLPVCSTLKETCVNPVDPLSALACYVALCLPSHPRDTISKGSRSDSRKLDDSCYRATLKIHRHLNNKNPKLAEHLFAKAIPYAWWARGYLRQAERTFLKLVQDCIQVDEKVLFMHEIARLHATCGNTHKCSKYLTAAVEILGTDKKAMKCTLREEEVHSQVLHAAYVDIGVNTEAKAFTAGRLWNNVAHLDMLPLVAVQEAITSLVCYHSAANSGLDRGLWEELEFRLKSFPLHQGELALALLYAMQGRRRESLEAFRSYVALFASGRTNGGMFRDRLPGLHFLQVPFHEVSRDFNPFVSLVNQVVATKTPVQPIRMVWRSRLATPTLNWANRSWAPTDFSFRNGTLWATEDFCITGDMMMILPPLINVKLNAYTGALNIAPFPEPPCLWTSSPGVDVDAKDEMTQVGVRRLFQDAQCCVDLYLTNTPQPHCVAIQFGHASYFSHCEAVYTSSDGSISRINLKKVLRAALRKRTEAIVRFEFKRKESKKTSRRASSSLKEYENEYRHTPRWLQEMCDTIADFDKHGRDLTFEFEPKLTGQTLLGWVFPGFCELQVCFSLSHDSEPTKINLSGKKGALSSLLRELTYHGIKDKAIDDVVREQFMKQREKKMGVKQKDKADTAKAKSSRGNVKRNPEAEDTPLKERKLDLHLVNFQVVGKSLFLLFDVHGCNAHQGEFLLVLNCATAEAFLDFELIDVFDHLHGGIDNYNRDMNHRYWKRCLLDFDSKNNHVYSMVTVPKLALDCCNPTVQAALMIASFSHLAGRDPIRFCLLTDKGERVLEYEASSAEVPWTHVIRRKMFGIHPTKKGRLICTSSDRSVISGELPQIDQIVQVEDKLLLRTRKGLCIVNEAFEIVSWKSHTTGVTVSEDGRWLLGKFERTAVLCRKEHANSRLGAACPVAHTLLALDNRVILLETNTRTSVSQEEKFVHCLLSLDVPGWATEAQFVSEEVGMLVAATLMDPDGEDNFHEENVFQFSYSGEVMGVLPGLGRGPHRFLPLYLPPSPRAAELFPEMAFDQPAWYVYCRDGHAGISCFRPNQ